MKGASDTHAWTTMLFGLFNRMTNAAPLKAALDVGAQRTRDIASRVAQGSLQGDGFALPAMTDPTGAAASTTATTSPTDLEREMTALADEQLRFEAAAKLLEKTYQSFRTTMRNN